MSEKLRILNVFGITPVGNGMSAGMDFFMPKFKAYGMYSKKMGKTIMEAFSKSYGKSEEELADLADKLVLYVTATKGEKFVENNDLNLLQLFLCLDSFFINDCVDLDDKIDTFVENYLVFDGNMTPGICLCCNDYIKVNSGIKLALDHDTCAIFFNKSGKGTKGWDIRACVIDEDYSGYVHISMCYNKAHDTDGTIYCGDKLTQLLVLPVKHTEPVEISEEEYNKLMNDSERGAAGFGSSDVKHSENNK